MQAIGQAFESLFGTDELPTVKVHGRTDEGILSDIFEFHSRDYNQHRDDFNHAYWSRLPTTLRETEGYVLPGVEQLIDRLVQLNSVHLGLLTGNSQRAAKIKLQHFQLDNRFSFGGFGDHHADRNDVARLAMESAIASVEAELVRERVWVIGDTVNDIVCARSIGAKVLVVETGGSSRDDLESAQPDAMMSTLEDANHFFQLVGLG